MRSRRLRVALVLVGLLGLAAVLRPFPAQFKFRHGGDAVRYLNWSTLIAKEGPKVFPSLLREYRQKWIGFPPPTRMFYLGTAGLLTRLWTQPGDVYHPLVLISWLSGVAVLLAVAFWMRRDFAWPTIVAALLLVAAAPVARAVSHFPLPDSLLALQNVWLFALVVEQQRQPRRALPWLIGLLALLMLLTRETGLFALVAVGAYVLYEWRRTKRFAWPTAIAIVGACLAATALVLVVVGGPGPFWEFVVDDVKAATTTTGSLPFVSGPPYTYFVSFMIVMPLVMVTTIGGAPAIARDGAARAAVVPMAILFGVELLIYCFFTKTLRYTIPCEIGIRMVCAVVVGLAWQRRRAWGIGLLVALLAVDEGLFLPLFGFDQVYDPTVWALARQLHMIPW